MQVAAELSMLLHGQYTSCLAQCSLGIGSEVIIELIFLLADKLIY